MLTSVYSTVCVFTLVVKSAIMKSLLLVGNLTNVFWILCPNFVGFAWLDDTVFDRISSKLIHGRTNRHRDRRRQRQYPKDKTGIHSRLVTEFCLRVRKLHVRFLITNLYFRAGAFADASQRHGKIDFWRETKLEMLNNSDTLSVDSQSLQTWRILERVFCGNATPTHIYI